MSNQKGMTLFEVTLVISLASVAVVASASYSLPWLSRERARASVYDVQAYLQLTRIEAVSRNHECRFVLDTSGRTLQVFDGKGTPGDSTDDELLYETTLTDQAQFARPDSGAAVSLAQIGSTSQYEAVFTADGSVSSGTGEVVLLGGEEFNRVTVFGAGGVAVERWVGNSWTNGHVDVASASSGGSGSGGSGGTNPGGGGGTTLDPIDDISTVDDTLIVDPDGSGGGVGDGYIIDEY